MSMVENFDDAYQIEPEQRSMLEALILPPPRDEQAFERWLGGVDLQRIDGISMRLVPALFGKFGGTMDDSGHRVAMRNIYRLYQFRTSILLASGRRVVEKLLDAGVDVLLFKGTALAIKYYGNPAVRPMSDVDVLVRRENIPQAEEILRECGFRYGYPAEKKINDIHSHDYVNDRLCGIDLHWYALYESVRARIDDGIWDRAKFFDWDGLRVKVMAPEDLLLTSIVNGVRDNPMRLDWIHDVATIISSEPAIAWDVAWKEARRRGLGAKLFHALGLVRRISQDAVPDTLLEHLVDGDPEFRGGLPWHMPLLLNEEGAITGLLVQWRFLALVAELFEISDRKRFDELVSGHPPAGKGYLEIPAGLLVAKTKPALPAYTARLSIVDGTDRLLLAPLEATEIQVEIINNSPHCWWIAPGSAAKIGVSYHLLAENGATLVGDGPRTYFLSAREGSISFIAPSQVLTCNVRITPPAKPGRYIVQFDIVHEFVRWFSDEGNVFPRLELEILDAGTEQGSCSIRGKDVVYESMGDETAIIDTTAGVYYTVSGYGSLIWNAIAEGHDLRDIVSAFAAVAASGVASGVVLEFIDSLLREDLIACSKRDEGRKRGDFQIDSRFGTQPPVLTRHGDARNLLAMHSLPVSELYGWPQTMLARARELDELHVRLARSAQLIDDMRRVLNRQQQLEERDAQKMARLREVCHLLESRSWRLSSPLRFVGSLLGRQPPMQASACLDLSSEQLDHLAQQIRASSSWKLTKPLRML